MFMNIVLFLITATIWGSSWLIITFQLHACSVAVAIGWRFCLASLVLAVGCGITRTSLRIAPRHFGLLALLGLTLFGFNYWLVYLAEVRLPSGLVALSFTILIAYNMIGESLFFKRSFNRVALVGVGVGVSGLILVYFDYLPPAETRTQTTGAMMLAIGGALCASVGNLLAEKVVQTRLQMVPMMSLAMGIGGVSMLALAAISGDSLALPTSPIFLSGFLFLTLVGTVLGFLAYFALIVRVGASRAAYTTLGMPIIALGLSTMFEGLQWQTLSVIGVIGVLAGAFIMHLSRAKS